ncbi:hypothetical protein KW516_19245 [Vibrio fluvialis]|nr:hypothetical protein [Vibrio fluvialis]
MTNAKNTNKSFLSAAVSSAVDGLTFSQEMFTKRAAENEKITETSSRRERLGEAGMRAETHSRMNSYLSGLQANEMKVVKMLNPTLDPANIINHASREHKKYVIGLCAVIAQETSAPNLQALNDAAKSINPQFSEIKKVHKTVFAMIEAITDNETSFSDTYIKELMQHDTMTQAGYVCGFFAKYGLGEVRKDGSRKIVTINNDHPLVQAIRALCEKKTLVNCFA